MTGMLRMYQTPTIKFGERKDIKYRADQVFKAIKYERSHPEIAKEIDEYMRRNGIVKVFP